MADFLHPRYAALLPWSAVVLWGLACAELFRWRDGADGGKVRPRHVVWVLPFIVFALLRPEGFSDSFQRSRGLSAPSRMLAQAQRPETVTDTVKIESAPDQDSGVIESTEPPSNDSDWITPLRQAASLGKAMAPVPVPLDDSSPSPPVGKASIWCDLPPHPGKACVDTIRDRLWYQQMLALYMDPHRHLGRRVWMVGRIQPDALFGNGWHHVGRMMIWCCAADASPVGFYARPATGAQVPDSGWVSVEGTLSVREGVLPGADRASPVPVVLDAVFHRVEPPRQENVFPFAY
ncbi:MAG: hypothetical protein IPN71_14495 [Fibrobacteres bacterium]|jgi:uncharacterized repeat protein (TIGR03943 family)|nr:hypothetical protein [Fibrobacterota bacterium]